MNLVRQRDDLREAFKVGAISKIQLEMALSSPVFCWHHKDIDLTKEEQEWMCDNVMYAPANRNTTFPRIVPFEVFRLSYVDAPVYEQFFVASDVFLCFRCDDGYSHKDIRLWSNHAIKFNDERYRLWMWCNGIRYNHDTRRAGKVELRSTQREMEDFASSPMNNLAFFLFDLMAGVSTVVKVTPDQPGRSVEWRQSREHYLLINRGEAKRSRECKGDPSTASIIRSAHWRRAHLRRLMSDKFKHKKGLLVPVRKAWVGPDEWKGKDGKIYKVTNVHMKSVDKLA